MIYDFTSRERELGYVVFALTFKRKRMTERVVISRPNDVQRRLKSKAGGFAVMQPVRLEACY
ncbi:MAG: hypothetical protein FWD25_12800 [Clostridia bacterium]|nr:hypothetical protein [Clostridia bacterium]